MPLFGDYYQHDLYAGRSRRWGRIVQAYLLRLLQLARSVSFNLVWIEYELFPWLPALGERLLAGLRIPYVVDYDDPIYHRYQLHPNRLVRAVLGTKIDAIMRWANTVIVGNQYLRDRAQAAGARRVECLPTVVDLERYPASAEADRSVFTVGWIGSPSTVGYLSLVAPLLRDFCRPHESRFVVVGAREGALDGVPAEFRPWSEATEVEDILRFDVGIMPLPDEPWERGKCGYKLIQYMACARPVIASPVGANQEIVEHGVNGFLASTDQEWRSALETLRDAGNRRIMGKLGRQKVETSYCTRVTAPLLASILSHAASTNGASS